MPRKRWLARLSCYDVPVINPQDRNAIALHDLVRHVLVDFDELAVLSSDPGSAKDIPAWIHKAGHDLIGMFPEQGSTRFVTRKTH